MARPPSTPEQALAFFEALSPSTMKLGLERVRAALSRLGEPQRRYRGLQVAGTNGKGSTCAFAAQILRQTGHKVGLYTSPHLIRVTERIQVDGEPISDALFGQRILEVLEKCPEALAGELTYFEVCTLVALWHFAKEQVEVAVLETGLGGRLDATTAAEVEVTTITPVSMDHLQYLGDTLGLIAAEKAGIIRPGVPLVVAHQEPEAWAAIEAVADARGSPVYLEGRDYAVTASAFSGLGRGIGGLQLSLAGEHQRHNAAAAITSVLLLEPDTSEGAIRAAVANTRWPGRLEVVQEHPTVLLDGAHNPGGALVLAEALKTLYRERRIHLVFGVLADKDHAGIRARLFPLCASLHLCPAPSPRALHPEESVPDAKRLCPHPDEVFTYGSVEAALDGALARATGTDVVLCAGSLFLVGAVRARFRK